ncbi:hypothetical protein ACFL2T_06400, partial [Elusimicrobiota bacterium]
LPESLTPLVFGFAGYGNVARGAQRILGGLPVEEVSPERLVSDFPDGAAFKGKRDRVYKVVFKEEHMVEPIESGRGFGLQDYYKHPEKYRGVFEKYLPYPSVLVNCIYWDDRYPRLVTKSAVKKLYGSDAPPRLRVLGDISCDIEGAFECNVKAADSGNPVYVFDPANGETVDGVAGRGPVVLSVDNLPCELGRESSTEFSEALMPFIPEMLKTDMSVSYEDVALPDPVKTGLLVHRGELTPEYRYIREFLDKHEAMAREAL